MIRPDLRQPAAAAPESGPDAALPASPWVQSAPWLLSVLLHAALAVTAVFVVWSTVAAPEEAIVPEVHLGDRPSMPLELVSQQRLAPDQAQPQPDTPPEPAPDTPVQPPAVPMELPTALLGVEGLDSAKLAPFGTTYDPQEQFATQFFGLEGNARRVVFVVDATGSLTDVFPFVLQELKRQVRNLSDQQTFSIIFFHGGSSRNPSGIMELPPDGLHAANTAAKAAAIAWMDDPDAVHIGPRSTPLGALERALSYDPQLVFLLSDNITGAAGRNVIVPEDLLAGIERLNAANTVINTIQFLYPDPLAGPDGLSTMERIARRTNGRYKFVSQAELQLQ